MMVLRGSVLAGIVLVASIAFADVAEDLLGEWTLLDPVMVPGIYLIFTFRADGTYQMEIITSGGVRTPVEEGTYEVSETDLVLRSAGEESRSEMIIGGGSLILYDPEEEQVLVFEKGVIAPEPLGTASISGTVSYDRETPAGIVVVAVDAQANTETGIAFLAGPGRYTIEGVPAGTYIVIAIPGQQGYWGYGPVGLYGTDNPFRYEPGLVTLGEGEHRQGIDIRIYGRGIKRSFDDLHNPWQSQDIGEELDIVGAAGDAGFSGDTLVVEASGFDIWDAADGFHFVYQQASGDVEIIARVGSIEFSHDWAKAGVMVRETLAVDSKHAMMAITSGNGAAFQYRMDNGSSSVHTAGSAASAPYWVKLTRRGDTFEGYESSDGLDWALASSADIPMASTVFVGLAVTSHNQGVINTATFSDVEVRSSTHVAASLIASGLPKCYALRPNVPNPFNAQTCITYEVPFPSEISLSVYDLLGQHICTLKEGFAFAGVHSVVWDGRDLLGQDVGSGMYFANLGAGGTICTTKLMLLR